MARRRGGDKIHNKKKELENLCGSFSFNRFMTCVTISSLDKAVFLYSK